MPPVLPTRQTPPRSDMNMAPGLLSLRHYGASHGSHAHSHFQVLLGLEGLLDLEIEGRGQRIAAGDGCVIPPGERHDFESRSGSRCLVLDTADAGWQYHAHRPMHNAHASSLARYLDLALQRGSPAAQQWGAPLLLEAWGAEGNQRLPHPPKRPQRPIDWRQLTAWARQHLHEPLTVAQLAQQVYLSPTQFASRCRSETGLSVMQWVRAQRLSLATHLRQRGHSVADTALQCGYLSPSALTAAMRKQRNAVTPSKNAP